MMKKLLVTLIALGFSSVAMAGIGETGAPHNFYDNQCGNNATNYWSYTDCGTNETAWNTTGEICKVCHIPHRDSSVDTANAWAEGALWNHKVTTQNFTPYDDTGLYGTITFAANNLPQGSSKLCLSCHDGVTGVDAFDSTIVSGAANIGTIGTNMYEPGANVVFGTNLTQHHPVSVTYEDGQTAAQLHADTDALGAFGNIADYLEENRVECATCHDPHGDRVSTSPNSLLRVRNTATGGSASDASALCLVCHDK